MTWEIAALGAALGFALKGFACKAAIRAGADEIGLMAWAMLASAVALGNANLFWPGSSTVPDPRGLISILVFCVIGATCATLCYFRAIHMAPLSVAMPIFALTSVFLIPTSHWMLGELPDVAGVGGIVAVVLGVSLLYVGQHSEEVLDRKSYVSGFAYALATAGIWSLTSNLDKRAVQLSSPVLYPFLLHTSLVPIFFALAPTLKPGGLTQTLHTKGIWMWLVLIAGTDVLILVCQMTAILQTNVAYVIAVKRSGAIIAVLLGWSMFGEGQILRRLAASVLISAGVGLLLLTHPS